MGEKGKKKGGGTEVFIPRKKDKRFTLTSSLDMEALTLLWSLKGHYGMKEGKVLIYCDQCGLAFKVTT